MACQQCTDDPWLNLSSEDPDRERKLSIKHFTKRPPLGWDFRATGCLGICVSDVSQEEADDCALAQAQICVYHGWDPHGPNDHPFQPPSIYTNDAVSCTIRCSDGATVIGGGENTFTWTIPAGTVVALSQEQADAIAASLACQRARQHRICISSTLAGGCVNQVYRQRVIAVGGTPSIFPYIGFVTPSGCTADEAAGDRTPYSPIRYIFSVIGGALPPGLELRACTGYIKGTPTASGTYYFTVRATDAIGSFQNKTLALSVIEITTDDSLPEASIGVEYLEPLVQNGGDPLTEQWTIIDGELPPGLELSTAGLLTGTPEGPLASYQFTAQVVVSGATCQKQFTLTISASANFYWSFEDDSLVDVIRDIPISSVSAFNNQEFVAGYFDRAVRVKPNTTSSFETWGYGTGILEELAFLNDGLLMATWLKVNVKNTNNFQTYLDYRQFDVFDTEVGGVYCLGRSNGMLGCFHYNTNGFNSSEIAFLASAGGPVALGTWYLLVMYLDSATNIVHVLVDNVEIGTIAALAPDPQPKGSFKFKNANGGPLEPGDFIIDEWTILLNAEITSNAKANYLWNGGTGRQCPCTFP